MIRWCFLILSSTMVGQTPTGESLTPQIAEPRDSRSDAATLSAKVLRYAKRTIRQYDQNEDDRLEADEWKSMRGRPQLADLNRDGSITIEEFARYVGSYGHRRRIRLVTSGLPSAEQLEPETPQTGENSATGLNNDKLRRDRKFFVPSSRLPKGLPQTFLNRDSDGDGQLTLSEFSTKPSPADLKRFQQLDANSDGVVTAREYMRGPRSVAPTEGETTESAEPRKK